MISFHKTTGIVVASCTLAAVLWFMTENDLAREPQPTEPQKQLVQSESSHKSGGDRSMVVIDSKLETIPGYIYPEHFSQLVDLEGRQREVSKKQKAFIATLGKDLSLKEREALYQFLLSYENNFYSLQVKDHIIILLESQNDLGLFIPNMIGLANDQDVNGDLRGYAVQHLRAAYEDLPASREQIKMAFDAFLDDVQSDVAGTTLLALSDYHRQWPDQFDSADIGRKAHDILMNGSSSDTARVAAVNVCGTMGVKESLPELRSLARQQVATTLRMAAIASLAQIGDPQDYTLLNELQSDDSTFVAAAAKAALKKYKQI